VCVVVVVGSDPIRKTSTTLVVVALWILWGASAPHTGPSGSTYIYTYYGSMEPPVPSAR
jgi:hypothetical protein